LCVGMVSWWLLDSRGFDGPLLWLLHCLSTMSIALIPRWWPKPFESDNTPYRRVQLIQQLNQLIQQLHDEMNQQNPLRRLASYGVRVGAGIVKLVLSDLVEGESEIDADDFALDSLGEIGVELITSIPRREHFESLRAKYLRKSITDVGQQLRATFVGRALSRALLVVAVFSTCVVGAYDLSEAPPPWRTSHSPDLVTPIIAEAPRQVVVNTPPPPPTPVVEQRTLTTSRTCNVRSAPSTRADILRSFGRAETVVVISTEGNWHQIASATGEQGWMHSVCFSR
jgi:hypothetical protein